MDDPKFKVNHVVESPPPEDGDKWFVEDFEEKMRQTEFQWHTNYDPSEMKDFLVFKLKMPVDLIFDTGSTTTPMHDLDALLKQASCPSERLLAIAMYIRKLEQTAKKNICNQ